MREFRNNSPNPNDVKELGIIFTQVTGVSPIETECMDEVRRQAPSRQWHVFSSVLDHSRTYERASRDQTAAFETKYARTELKSNIASIVREMEARLASARKAKVRK